MLPKSSLEEMHKDSSGGVDLETRNMGVSEPEWRNTKSSNQPAQSSSPHVGPFLTTLKASPVHRESWFLLLLLRIQLILRSGFLCCVVPCPENMIDQFLMKEENG